MNSNCLVCGNAFYVDPARYGSAKHCSIECKRDLTYSYYIQPVTECWEWKGAKDNKGYGRVTRNGKTIQAHRLFYENQFGKIPDGFQIDHLCRNKCCVNPKHLEPVTNKENGERTHRIRAARAATECPNGHPWTLENTYIAQRSGSRVCRACTRIKQREYQQRKHANAE